MSGRRTVFLTCISIAALAILPALTMAEEQDATCTEGDDWTIVIYVDADNNFDTYWAGVSQPLLLKIPNSESVNIVAFVDLLSTNYTQVVEISNGVNETVAIFPEMNFGDGETLEWVIEEAHSRYMSDHLAVIAWDHGSAWSGFCVDDTSGGDKISLAEMEDAIVGAAVPIDILAFDACASGSIETAYQASCTGLVGYIVASEELVAGDGFPYDLMFTPVALDPTKCPKDVAHDMVLGWAQYYDPLEWAWYSPLSAIDIGAVTESMGTVKAWCDAMAADLDQYRSNYKVALRDSYTVSCSQYQVDLVDLGRHILADAAVSDPVLRSATEAMMTAVGGAVVFLDDTDRTAACGGISVYWGVRNTWVLNSDAYSAISFAQFAGWWAFLDDYNT